jgi:hypothetical protein
MNDEAPRCVGVPWAGPDASEFICDLTFSSSSELHYQCAVLQLCVVWNGLLSSYVYTLLLLLLLYKAITLSHILHPSKSHYYPIRSTL